MSDHIVEPCNTGVSYIGFLANSCASLLNHTGAAPLTEQSVTQAPGISGSLKALRHSVKLKFQPTVADCPLVNLATRVSPIGESASESMALRRMSNVGHMEMEDAS